MSNTRRKLENMAEMEKRNEQRIGAFISKEAEIEHIRETAIARYMHELNID